MVQLEGGTGRLMLPNDLVLSARVPARLLQQVARIWTPNGNGLQPAAIRRHVWLLMLISRRLRDGNRNRNGRNMPFELWANIFCARVTLYDHPHRVLAMPAVTTGDNPS